MTGKTKAMMFCPWCDEGQARTWQGITAHVRAKHPDKITELKDNKTMYLDKFACDEFGNPIGPAPAPKAPEPTPVPEPQVPAPTPTPTPTPKQNPEPKEPPAPTPVKKGEGDPAPEGGLFHRLGTGLFG